MEEQGAADDGARLRGVERHRAAGGGRDEHDPIRRGRDGEHALELGQPGIDHAFSVESCSTRSPAGGGGLPVVERAVEDAPRGETSAAVVPGGLTPGVAVGAVAAVVLRRRQRHLHRAERKDDQGDEEGELPQQVDHLLSQNLSSWRASAARR